MIRIPETMLWIGQVGDVWNVRTLLDEGIAGLVDLAGNEPMPQLPRDLVYCRFPLVDGAGNSQGLLQLAVQTVAGFLQAKIPTLVYCSAGLSRTPAVVAAAVSVQCGVEPEYALERLSQITTIDLTPSLWYDVCNVLKHLRKEPT